MNMREAILAGSQRVAGRHIGGFFTVRPGRDARPELLACALGAAFLGCHPDVDVTPPDDDWLTPAWRAELYRACVQWVYSDLGGWSGGPPDVGEVAQVNDAHDLGYGWDEIVNLLPDEVARVQVCDAPDA
jgi:hypothetical protein